MFVPGKKHRRIVHDLQFIIADLQEANDRLAKQLFKLQNADKIKAVKKAVKTPPTKRVVKKEVK